MESHLSLTLPSLSEITNDRFAKGEKHKIIKELLKPDTQINWAQEMTVFTRLFKKYPKAEFWRKFNLSFKLNSLRWLQGDGETYVKQQWFKNSLAWDSKEQIIEGKEKVGADYIPPKQLNLKDFLKG